MVNIIVMRCQYTCKICDTDIAGIGTDMIGVLVSGITICITCNDIIPKTVLSDKYLLTQYINYIFVRRYIKFVNLTNSNDELEKQLLSINGKTVRYTVDPFISTNIECQNRDRDAYRNVIQYRIKEHSDDIIIFGDHRRRDYVHPTKSIDPKLQTYIGLEKARNIMLLIQIRRYKLIEESLVPGTGSLFLEAEDRFDTSKEGR